MESVLAGVTTCITLCSNVMTAIFDNAYLSTFAGASLLVVGIWVFRSFKKGAAH